MKFLATTLTVLISFLAISNAEDSPSVNLRGSVSESSDEVERPADFLEYVEEEDDASMAGTNLKYPVADGNNMDVLLQSYSMDKGVPMGGPFESLKDCSGRTNTDDDACFEDDIIPVGDSRHYDRLIKDSRSKDEFLSTIAKAEGGSLGLKVSASASYASERSDSSESISYMIGGYRETSTRRVDDFSKLKLTKDARILLDEEPHTFLSSYGQSYIRSVTYGGSFLGSFHMTSKSSADSNELKAEASFSYDGGFYSASGMASYNTRMENSESKLDREGDFGSRPGIEGRAIVDPDYLNIAYKEWNDKVEETPAPLHVYLGRWFDSRDVQSVLNSPSWRDRFNQSTRDLFTQDLSVDQHTVEVASNEKVSSAMLMNTIKGIMEWPEVKNNNTLSDEAKMLLGETERYNVACSNRMNGEQLYLLMNELIDGNADKNVINNPFGSWLHYRNELNPKYQKFIASLPERPQDTKYNIWTGASTAAVESALVLEREDMPLNRSDTSQILFYDDSFCTQSQLMEGMKEYYVSSKPNPLRSRVTRNKAYSLRDGFQESGSFWAYDTQQPDTTEWVILDRQSKNYWWLTDSIIPSDDVPDDWNDVIIDKFWARRAEEYENC
jgi:hypothetical protein